MCTAVDFDRVQKHPELLGSGSDSGQWHATQDDGLDARFELRAALEAVATNKVLLKCTHWSGCELHSRGSGLGVHRHVALVLVIMVVALGHGGMRVPGRLDLLLQVLV